MAALPNALVDENRTMRDAMASNVMDMMDKMSTMGAHGQVEPGPSK